MGGVDEVTGGEIRKALQGKASGKNTLTTAGTQRKRAALGDLSNVVKHEPADGKDGKKAAAARAPLVSKASQSAGIQKVSRANSTRSALGTKDANKKAAADLKRPASGSGVLGGAHKKRSTGSGASHESIKEEALTQATENEAPAKKAVAAEVQQEVKIEKIEVKPQYQAPAVVAVQQDMDEEVPDLDAEDLEDPLMVAEYAVEIFDYLRDLETSTQPNPDYMDHQDHIEWTDRDVLNDWLVQVHQRFQLLPETFYLAINIIDRFLSTKIVQLDKLQLVGITAMFIASKYEEVISPHVSNFTYMAKDYQDSEILSAERFILSSLGYDLSYPNPMNFLRRISKADNYDIQTRTLGKYLLEISCLDHRFMEFCPSHVAAASMYMARMILERGEWVSLTFFVHVPQVLIATKDTTIAHYSGYTEQEVLPVFDLLLDYCSAEIKHDAFHSKYASKKYLKGRLAPLLSSSLSFEANSISASLLVRQWADRYMVRSQQNQRKQLSSKSR